jgi:hypothetical protein
MKHVPIIPACNHDCSQGRGDCPCPEACHLPVDVKAVHGGNLPTWRTQIHATAEQAERWLLWVAIVGTIGLVCVPDSLLMSLGMP